MVISGNLNIPLKKAVIISDSNKLDKDDFQLTRKKESTAVTSVSTLEEMEKIMIQKAMEKHRRGIFRQ